MLNRSAICRVVFRPDVPRGAWSTVCSDSQAGKLTARQNACQPLSEPCPSMSSCAKSNKQRRDKWHQQNTTPFEQPVAAGLRFLRQHHVGRQYEPSMPDDGTTEAICFSGFVRRAKTASIDPCPPPIENNQAPDRHNDQGNGPGNNDIAQVMGAKSDPFD